MARAHSVWVLSTQGGSEPAHAFTVKHELVSHMRDHSEGLKGRSVFKLPDGAMGREPVHSWVAAEFLATHG